MLRQKERNPETVPLFDIHEFCNKNKISQFSLDKFEELLNFQIELVQKTTDRGIVFRFENLENNTLAGLSKNILTKLI